MSNGLKSSFLDSPREEDEHDEENMYSKSTPLSSSFLPASAASLLADMDGGVIARLFDHPLVKRASEFARDRPYLYSFFLTQAIISLVPLFIFLFFILGAVGVGAVGALLFAIFWAAIAATMLLPAMCVAFCVGGAVWVCLFVGAAVAKRMLLSSEKTSASDIISSILASLAEGQEEQGDDCDEDEEEEIEGKENIGHGLTVDSSDLNGDQVDEHDARFIRNTAGLSSAQKKRSSIPGASAAAVAFIRKMGDTDIGDYRKAVVT